MTTTLEYVILGHVIHPDHNDEDFELLAYSEGVPLQDKALYRALIDLEPMPIADERQSQSIAMVSYDPHTAVLARAHYQPDNQDLLVMCWCIGSWA